MSRTNHYRLCDECTVERLCWCHERWSNYVYKPIREIIGRRNWKRKDRWPYFSPKHAHGAPPRWWWQEQHSRARAMYRQMMHRDEDPSLPAEKRLIDMWDWY